MANTDAKSLKLSGSSQAVGGQYDTVHGSGSTRITGDVTSDSFHMSGSSHHDGSLITQSLHVSGSSRWSGSVSAQEGRFSGAVRIDGNLHSASELTSSGSMRVAGSVAGESLRGSGSLRVDHEISLEHLSWSGLIHCPGLVSADTIELHLVASSTIGEIAGSHIVIHTRHVGPWSWPLDFLSSGGAKLAVTEISGDVIEISYTEATVVRGDHVTVGPHCRIQRIEYRDTLDVDTTSRVDQKVQVTPS